MTNNSAKTPISRREWWVKVLLLINRLPTISFTFLGAQTILKFLLKPSFQSETLKYFTIGTHRKNFALYVFVCTL